MGFLDSLENSPALRGVLGQLGAAVLPAVLGEVMGTGSQGGLNAIVAKLEQSGLGDQVKSWIGTGQNLPITADQVRQVLGNDAVKQLAAKYNIRSTRSPNCSPISSRSRSITPARMASCPIPPDPSKVPVPQPRRSRGNW